MEKIVTPSLTAQDALKLASRLHKKFKDIDHDRALRNSREFVALQRMELDELVGGLEKLKERLEWAV